MERDSVLGTFVVATVLCVVCSVLVAGAAVGLKDKQEAQKTLDRNKNVLIAAGLCEKDATEQEVKVLFDERINLLLIDLATGKPAEELSDKDKANYDPRKAAKQPDTSEPVTPPGDLPGIARREKATFVYEIKGEEGGVEGYVLPIYGKGLWSTLRGFLAMQGDGRTVRGITFYEHAETPGLGGEVDNPKWKSQWPDKVALDDQGDVLIEVLKGGTPITDPEHQVDGLSGATITTKGVSNLVRYWLGEDGFGKFLEQNARQADSAT
ncbi:Na(+)-translocating NADH-quinone reductase subunit C [Pirellulimonas nuda]|uniref:Na(+)-translocating NADH-quinone reductase subunit C n=1 Tax=Pirellulimonas nuda TaxID=2528009 RepID=A0A518DEW9_9BACT|nr:Na(+)-translocating NADH-quinone reductase subunit C [Pirellulimonas nuda]QDU90017.1 Na(+)-translocating NADH-quinone reductase subunit C [Pirellulimonas nuda]